MGKPIRTFPESLAWCNFIASVGCNNHMEPKKKSKPERLFPDVVHAEKEKVSKILPPSCR